jgi:signal transduction histidine kinase/ligand-binding sensor domain-containing protein/DNA-binding response OmpR family regulator
MSKLFRLINLFIVLLMLVKASAGQEYKLYSTNDGLSKSTVFAIFKDSRGFMWFGTSVGLNRFDGYKFIHYYFDVNDTNSISNNNIGRIVENEDGDLWISTNYGLNKFIFDENRFERFYHHEDLNSISSNYIHSIYLDRDNFLWITTSEGIDKYDESTGKFTHYSYTPHQSGNKDKVAVYDIIMDGRGVLWLCTEMDGLLSFYEDTGQFVSFTDTRNDGSGNGNKIFGRTFLGINDDKIEFESIDGIYEFDLKKKTFSRSENEKLPSELKEFTNSKINSRYTDNTGKLWFGIENIGVVLVDYTRNKFTSYSHSNSNRGLPGEIVSAIAEDKNGIIWIGTNAGLCSFNPLTREFTNRYNSNKAVYRIAENIISLYFERTGALWVGTDSGAFRYDFSSRATRSFQHSRQDSSSLLDNRVEFIFEDSMGNIWLGAGGLNLYQPSTGNFKQFKPEKNSETTVNSEYIMSMYEDDEGKLWLGTWAGGINIFDPKEERFTFMLVDVGKNGPLKTNDVGSIYKDSKGFLWFTSTGVTRYNPRTKEFNWYSTQDGLPNNAISDVLEDNHGMIWISTSNGLSLFNPETGHMRNFDRLDGLQGNEFIYNTALKSSEGKLYFGGTNGFSIIDPDNMMNNEFSPHVVITDFQIFNRSVKIGEKTNGHVLLERNITSTREITLHHFQNVFSFEFAALHYSIPEKNQYAFKLEGLETDWNYAGADRRYATYTSLDPGEYVFRVIAANSDGLWNEEGYSLRIIVLPPWWKTTWFLFLLIFVLFFLIIGFYYIQLHSIKTRNKRLDHLVKLKTRDLEHANLILNEQKNNLLVLNESLEKHQKEIILQKEEISQQNTSLKAKNMEILDMSQRIHDQDQMKLRYFTNISHEFRTPLTLILSPLDKLLATETLSSKHSDQLSLVKSNAQRLLSLVNQLLDIGKIESGRMKVKKTDGDFVCFVQSIFDHFKEQAEQRNISFMFDCKVKELIIRFDYDKMEKILYNLLSNSLKFTPGGGKVTLALYADNNDVIVSVADTGIGISRQDKTKIFEPFYQVDSSSTRYHEGSGIGLYHTRELIELIDGKIDVESEPGSGTTISISFPLEPALFADIAPGNHDSNEKEFPSPGDVIDSGLVHTDNKLKLQFRPNLLIVEDNLEMRTYIKSELSSRYNIIEAVNGKEGVALAKKNFPDLIISDVMMPEMNGLDLCRIIKEDELVSHIPVILLTARVEIGYAIEGLETGADDYIPKPFNIDFLEARIEQLLTSRRILKEKFSKEFYSEPSNIPFTNADKVFLQKLIKLVEDNLAEEDFLVNDIAQGIGMSKTNLYRKVLALTNQSVADFVRNIRLKKAAHLLLSNEYSVSEVASHVGFKDTSHFIKSFTRQYNYTPKKFVEQQRANQEM